MRIRENTDDTAFLGQGLTEGGEGASHRVCQEKHDFIAQDPSVNVPTFPKFNNKHTEETPVLARFSGSIVPVFAFLHDSHDVTHSQDAESACTWDQRVAAPPTPDPQFCFLSVT